MFFSGCVFLSLSPEMFSVSTCTVGVIKNNPSECGLPEI